MNWQDQAKENDYRSAAESRRLTDAEQRALTAKGAIDLAITIAGQVEREYGPMSGAPCRVIQARLRALL